MAQKIDELAEQVPDMSTCIFNIHGPPYGSNLDLAPELDEDFTPTMEGGGLKMKAVGSTAVLEAIRKYQPLLALHGHIHECSAGIKIGRTLCINTGSEYHEGVLRGSLVILDEKKGVKNFWLGIVRNLQPGVTELYIHAALASDELKAITGSWPTRSQEFELFAHDTEMKQLVSDQKIMLIGYRALRDLQRGKNH